MPRIPPPVVVAGSLNSRDQPELTVDDQFLLRPWTVADKGVVANAYSDPAIQLWIRRSLDLREAEDSIAKWNRDWQEEVGAYWALARRDDGSVIGWIALVVIDLEAGLGEVAYWVSASARGCGAASIATATLASWAVDELGLHRIELHHSVHNFASCRVAIKAGFELEGTHRSALLHQDGWHDMHAHTFFGKGLDV